MGLNIAKKPTFKARVKVETPNMEGGHTTEQFWAIFERLPQSELEALKGDDRAGLKRVWIGWEDVMQDKEPVPFSEETRDRLIDDSCIYVAVNRAYFEAVTKGVAKAGN